MAGTQIQTRRGTTAQHSAFTGAVGEITVDTDKKTVVVHDGATAGGIVLARSSDVSAVLNFKNRIINGGMVIDQRNAGANITPTASAYTIDRWTAYISQPSKLSLQQNAGSITPPAGFTNYLGITSLSAYSVLSTDYFHLRQEIEGFNVADLGWGTANAQTITLSFRVYSSLIGTFGGVIRNGAFNRSYPFSYSIPVANTWTTISLTIAGDTTGTWATNSTNGLSLAFGLGSGSTYTSTAGSWQAGSFIQPTGSVSVVGTSGATFYITGVQLEKGSVATSFDQRAYSQELAMCQRYYQNIICSVNDNGAAAATKFYNTSAPYQCSMRATPTAIFSALVASNVTSTTFTNIYNIGATYTVVASGGPSMSSVSSVFLSAEL